MQNLVSVGAHQYTPILRLLSVSWQNEESTQTGQIEPYWRLGVGNYRYTKERGHNARELKAFYFLYIRKAQPLLFFRIKN